MQDIKFAQDSVKLPAARLSHRERKVTSCCISMQWSRAFWHGWKVV